MKCIKDLEREIAKISAPEHIDQVRVRFIFGKVREFFDHKPENKSKHKQLHFFCNWCAHPRLTQSEVIYNMFLYLTAELTICLNPPPERTPKEATHRFTHYFSEILDIPKIRQSLIEVFNENHLDTSILRSKVLWYAIVRALLDEISEKTISFPENTPKNKLAAKYYVRMHKIPNVDPKNIILVLGVTKNVDKESAHVVAIAQSNTRYAIELYYAESDESFDE